MSHLNIKYPDCKLWSINYSLKQQSIRFSDFHQHPSKVAIHGLIVSKIIFDKYFYIVLFKNNLQYTAQKMKFSIKNFFSNCNQICNFLRIWSHLLKKSLMQNFIFCAVILPVKQSYFYLVFGISCQFPKRYVLNKVPQISDLISQF